MIARAVAKYIRISPKKARLVTRHLKGMSVADAYAFLRSANKRSAYYLHSVLRSAFDNARRKDKNYKETDLYICKVSADSGPALRRFRAASMGRASLIKKRMSHITVELEARETLKEKKEEAPGKKRTIFKKGRGDKKSAEAASPARPVKRTARKARK